VCLVLGGSPFFPPAVFPAGVLSCAQGPAPVTTQGVASACCGPVQPARLRCPCAEARLGRRDERKGWDTCRSTPTPNWEETEAHGLGNQKSLHGLVTYTQSSHPVMQMPLGLICSFTLCPKAKVCPRGDLLGHQAGCGNSSDTANPGSGVGTGSGWL